MAKYKHSDLIEPGNPAIETVKGLEQLLEIIKKLTEESRKLQKELPKSFKTGADVQKLIVAKQQAASATQKQTAAEREAAKAAASLDRQRQRGLATMAKEESKQRELIAASQLEGKSLDELQRKVSALIALRKQMDISSAAGKKGFDQMTAAIRQGNQALQAYDRQIGVHNRNVGNYRSALQGLQTSFVAMAGAVTATIMVMRRLGQKLSEIRNTFMGFEYNMAKVRAISGATDEQFAKLSENVRRLGRDTRFTAMEVATLQKNFAKLGFKPDEILSMTEATLMLAEATESDLATSAEVAGQTLRAFGMDASEMQRVVDVMAKSFTSSALDLDRFANSMPKIAALASALGISLEETTAMLSVLTSNGIEAETAGTMLRQMFLAAEKDGFKMSEALADIAGSTNQAGAALKYFDTRAIPVALTLANNTDAVRALSNEYENSAGSVQEMAGIMGDTLQGAMFKMKSASESMRISIGEALRSQFLRFAEVMTNISKRIEGMSASGKRNAAMFTSLAVVLIPISILMRTMATQALPAIIGGFRGLVSVVRTGTVALQGMNAAMKANIITAGLTVILTVFTAIKSAVAGAKDEVQEFAEVTDRYADISAQASANVSAQVSELESLAKQITNTSASTDERNKALKQFNQISGLSIKANSDMAAMERVLTQAIKDTTIALEQKMKTEIIQKKIEKDISDRIDASIRAEEAQKKHTHAAEAHTRALRQMARATKDASVNDKTFEQIQLSVSRASEQKQKAAEELNIAQVDLAMATSRLTENTGSLQKHYKALTTTFDEQTESTEKGKNALEILSAEVSALETQMNLAILSGQNWQGFLDKLVPKQQQLDRVQMLSKLFKDLAMGADVLNMKDLDKLKIDIDIDWKSLDDDIEFQMTKAMESMEALSAQTAKSLVPLSLKEMLGLTDKDVSEIQTALKTITAEFNRMFGERKRLADEAVHITANQVSQTISLLDLELQKRAQGLANQTSFYEQQLKEQQKAQKEALEEQRRASILLIRMQQLETGASMIKAVANIFAKETGTKGAIGVITSIAGIAAMLGAFAGYQQQIKSLKMESGGRFQEGERGRIVGDRHSAASGGEWLSDHIQAERGEKVYVLSRQKSQSPAGTAMDQMFDAVNAGRDVSGILKGGARMMTPVIVQRKEMSSRELAELVRETKLTNTYLAKWKFYDPITGVVIDLQGNKQGRA